MSRFFSSKSLSVLRSTALLLVALCLSVGFVSCSAMVSGESVASENADGLTFTAYGGTMGIKTVTVCDSDGKLKQKLGFVGRVGEPFSENDGENYGFCLRDADFDGKKDITVVRERSKNGIYYDCFLNINGEFVKNEFLSSLCSPKWDSEQKTVCFTETSRVKFTTAYNAPPNYIDTVKVSFYSPIPEKSGRFTLAREEALIYYSDTEIYCYAISVPDNNGELEIISEKWIAPDKLEKSGLADFGK